MKQGARICGACVAVIALSAVASVISSSGAGRLPILLREVTKAAGIHFVHDNAASPDMFLIETMGAGCGWLDYDGDGWLDLFFVQSSPTPSYHPSQPLRNALYRNLGNGTFVDVTEQVGLGGPTKTFGMGVAVGDYNNDGRPDLYVTGYPRSILYRNEGGHFVDVTESAGVANAGRWGTSAAFFDYDNDGWLDLVVANYVDWSYDKNIYCGDPRPGYRTYCHPDQFRGVSMTLYHNNRDGTFTDVTRSAGLELAGKGLGVVAADYDNDGWMDIFVANDSVRNFLFHNNHDGTFREVALEAGVAYGLEGRAEAGMGVDFGDYDRDGYGDFYVTHLDLEFHRLFRNSKGGVFYDATHSAGLAGGGNFLSGFGTKFVDLANSGWLDILQVNGHILPNIALYKSGVTYAEPKSLWWNQGNSTFREVSALVGPEFLRPRVSRGLAVADYDNNGTLDFAVSNNGQPAELWRNERENHNNWITLTLVGKKSNRDGVGARVAVTAGNVTQTQQKIGGGSYLSASDPRLHFGLGEATCADRLRVVWPSGVADQISDVPVDRFFVLHEGAGQLIPVGPAGTSVIAEASAAGPRASGKPPSHAPPQPGHPSGCKRPQG